MKNANAFTSTESAEVEVRFSTNVASFSMQSFSGNLLNQVTFLIFTKKKNKKKNKHVNQTRTA
jgi:hypothetical protein